MSTHRTTDLDTLARTPDLDTIKSALLRQGFATPADYERVVGKPPTTQRFLNFILAGENYALPLRTPRPSDRTSCPWIEQGISEATFYRRKAESAKWSALLGALGAEDTGANRKLYSQLARTASACRLSVAELWARHVATLVTPPHPQTSPSLNDDGKGGV